MITATHVIHRGARAITREELAQIEAPQGTDTWYPLAHSELLKRVVGCLSGAGYGIRKIELAVSPDNFQFFGTLSLESTFNDEVALAVGIRNSNAKKFPIGFCTGNRVFVCDNLSFSGELVISRRHTRFGETRYQEALSRAVLSLTQYQEQVQHQIAALKSWELRDQEADSLILRSFEAGIVSTRILPNVIKEWREPSHAEFAPRTGWSLFNAYTEALKPLQASNPQEAALKTINLHKLLTPSGETFYAQAV